VGGTAAGDFATFVSIFVTFPLNRFIYLRTYLRRRGLALGSPGGNKRTWEQNARKHRNSEHPRPLSFERIACRAQRLLYWKHVDLSYISNGGFGGGVIITRGLPAQGDKE